MIIRLQTPGNNSTHSNGSLRSIPYNSKHANSAAKEHFASHCIVENQDTMFEILFKGLLRDPILFFKENQDTWRPNKK